MTNLKKRLKLAFGLTESTPRRQYHHDLDEDRRKKVVRILSSGNISLQSGRYRTEADLEEQRRRLLSKK